MSEPDEEPSAPWNPPNDECFGCKTMHYGTDSFHRCKICGEWLCEDCEDTHCCEEEELDE